MSYPTWSIVQSKTEYIFWLQLLNSLCTLLSLLSTMLQKLSTTICVTVSIVHCTTIIPFLIKIYLWIGGPVGPLETLSGGVGGSAEIQQNYYVLQRACCWLLWSHQWTYYSLWTQQTSKTCNIWCRTTAYERSAATSGALSIDPMIDVGRFAPEKSTGRSCCRHVNLENVVELCRKDYATVAGVSSHLLRSSSFSQSVPRHRRSRVFGK